MKSQNLSNKNSNTDEDARHKAQETTEVLWSDFSQEHGHYAKRDPCSIRKGAEIIFKDNSEYISYLTFALDIILSTLVV